MGELIRGQSHKPCEDCGSSDGLSWYKNDDGLGKNSHCFVCGRTRIYMEKKSRLEGLNKKTLDFFGVTEDEDFTCSFPFYDTEGNQVAVKKRTYDKKFFFEGQPKQATLFGRNKFPGNGKYITVTEGEVDCLSVYEMMGSKYPVVSIMSASQKLSQEEYRYLNSFDTIVLNFDSDEPGRAAAKRISSLFPLGKCKILHLKEAKDANDYFKKGLKAKYSDEWWKAEDYKPQGLVYGKSTWDIFEKTEEVEALTYPWEGMSRMLTGIYKPCLVVVSAGSGVGKCFAENTEILMYDGSTKFVQNVSVGDELMGPDSRVRKVLSAHKGRSILYDIVPIKGEKFTVNGEHTLFLQDTRTKKYCEYSVKEYLKLSSSIRNRLKLVRSEAVNFCAKNSLLLDPYFLGLWLGDGATASVKFTNIDKKLIKYWEKYVESYGLYNRKDRLTTCASSCRKGGYGRNKLLNRFNQYGLINNKHIPHEFKTSSISNRLNLLAGLIDTDGYLVHNCYEIVQKNKTLADDIVFVARSLGFCVTVKEVEKKCQTGSVGRYYRIFISGEIDRIPVLLSRKKGDKRKQIKNHLRTGFTVVEKSVGKYFGFEVDQDNLFLLKDFTVVHNSAFCKEIIYHLVKEHKQKVGCAFLEEGLGRTVADFVSIEMKQNLRLPDVLVSKDEKREAWSNLFGQEEEKFIFWKHFGSNNIDAVEEQIRYMAQGFGAKYIILDHISILVSDQANGDERKALDEIMTRLRTLVEETEICLFLVSHLKRSDGTPHEEGGVTSLAQLRGSAAIGQLADAVIGLERDGQSEDKLVRNTTTVRVLKNRLIGETGPCTHLLWDRETSRLTEIDINEAKQKEDKKEDDDSTTNAKEDFQSTH